MAKQKTINSLIDFINMVNDISEIHDNYFYRGESELFKKPLLANGYRTRELISSLGLDHIKNEFFRAVGFSLDPDSRNNFTAYSQHHGLPTELLDITKNPLVALYFAIESSPEQEGIVYVISDNSHIVDVLSDIELDNENEFRHLRDDIYSARTSFEESGGKLIKFSKGHFLTEIYSRSKVVESLDGVKYEKRIVNNTDLPLDSVLKLVSYVLKAHQKNVLYSIIHSEENFKKNETRLFELMVLFDKYSNSSTKKELYQFYLEFQNTNFVRDLIINPDQIDKGLFSDSWQPNRYNTKPLFLLFIISLCIRDNAFPPFPKLIYKPSIIFDRLTNQQASFIYQASFDKSLMIKQNDSNDKNTIKTQLQPISYDYKIFIQNKKSIKKELDRIGINEKFIYPDSDNIAHYIKKRYGY